MRYIRWTLLFAAVAAVWACTPFVGKTSDGGGRNLDSSPGMDADADAAISGSDSKEASDVAVAPETPSAVDAVVDNESLPIDSSLEERAEALSRDATEAGAPDTGIDHPTCPGSPTCKKPDGEICTADAECATGTCGGRCCAAGCSCTQPNSTNLLLNPGIDRDTSGWSIENGTLSRSLSDAERCPYSGSMTTNIPAGGGNISIGQCVPNTPLKGDFNFGASVYSTGGGFVVACQLVLYSGFHCDADQIATNETDSSKPDFGWNDISASLTMISGANSFDFRCALEGDAQDATTFYLDMLYVSRAPNRY
jgi:hypothetical protein